MNRSRALSRLATAGVFFFVSMIAAGAFASAPPPAAPVEIVPQLGHSGEIKSFVITPNGRYAVTSEQHALKVWDLVSHKELRTMAGGAYWPQLQILPDSKTVLQIGNDNAARVLDLTRGATLAELGPAQRLTVSADGRLAATSNRKTIKIFELPEGKLRNSFVDETEEEPDRLGFTPDGTQLIIGHPNSVPQLWDAAAGTILRALAGFRGPSLGFTFSRDGQTLVSAEGRGPNWFSDAQTYLTVLDGTTLERRRSAASTALAQDVALSPDGSRAVSQQYRLGGRPLVWDVASGEAICQINATLALNRFSADGKQIIGVRNDHLDVYDASTCKKLDGLPSRGELLSGAQISADGNMIIVAQSSALNVWDLAGLRYKGSPKLPAGVLNSFALSAGGKRLLMTNGNDLVMLDLETNQLVKTYPAASTTLNVAMSRDEKLGLVGTIEDARLYDLASGKVLRTFADVGWTDRVAFSAQGDRALLVGHKNEVRLVDLKTNAAPKVLELGEGNRGCAAFSPDGKQIAFGGNDNVVGVIDLASGQVRRFLGHTGWILTVDFSPDGKLLASASFDGTVRVWDVASGKQLQVLADHHSLVFTARFSPDGKRLVSSGSDGTIRIWPLNSYLPVTMLSTATDWIVYTRDGYFDSSLHGANLVAVVQGMEGFAVDQFALRYNRPDLIFQQLGMGAPELLEHYHSLYLKRLKRAGIKEEEFAKLLEVPKASISSSTTTGESLALLATCAQAHAPLRSYNIYDNGVPLYAPPGKTLDGAEAGIKETIALSKGNNRIELACTDAAGAESYRALVMQEGHSNITPDLYYLGLGVSQYEDPTLALGFADKDAKDLGEAFAKMSGYGNVHVKVLANEEATVPALQHAKEFLQQARVGDTVVLFVAGHGVHADDKEGTYYFLTHEAKLTDLAHSAAAFETIEDLLQGLTARNKFFLLDTCESGEQQEAVAPPADGPVHLTSRGVRGLKRVSSTGAPAKPLRGYLLEKDRYIYDNLTRRSGAIVFSSSQGGEYSYESADYSNGAFSAELLKALRSPVADADHDGFVSSDELRAYVSKAVPLLTQDRQHPTVDRDNAYQKLLFPLVLATPAPGP